MAMTFKPHSIFLFAIQSLSSWYGFCRCQDTPSTIQKSVLQCSDQMLIGSLLKALLVWLYTPAPHTHMCDIAFLLYLIENLFFMSWNQSLSLSLSISLSLSLLFVCLFVCFDFCDRVSICNNPNYNGTFFVDQVRLELPWIVAKIFK